MGKMGSKNIQKRACRRIFSNEKIASSTCSNRIKGSKKIKNPLTRFDIVWKSSSCVRPIHHPTCSLLKTDRTEMSDRILHPTSDVGSDRLLKSTLTYRDEFWLLIDLTSDWMSDEFPVYKGTGLGIVEYCLCQSDWGKGETKWRHEMYMGCV
jgi:hypothetical protein